MAEERRESDRKNYRGKIMSLISAVEQLVFVDEMSKDERDVQRTHGYKERGKPLETSLPFIRGTLSANLTRT